MKILPIVLILVFLSALNPISSAAEGPCESTPVYKILREKEWLEFKNSGVFHGSSDDKRDGYIHMSPANQIERIVKKYFATEKKVIVVEFKKLAFLEMLIWEPASGGVLYPHLYGRPLMLEDMSNLEIINQ